MCLCVSDLLSRCGRIWVITLFMIAIPEGDIDGIMLDTYLYALNWEIVIYFLVIPSIIVPLGAIGMGNIENS